VSLGFPPKYQDTPPEVTHRLVSHSFHVEQVLKLLAGAIQCPAYQLDIIEPPRTTR